MDTAISSVVCGHNERIGRSSRLAGEVVLLIYCCLGREGYDAFVQATNHFGATCFAQPTTGGNGTFSRLAFRSFFVPSRNLVVDLSVAYGFGREMSVPYVATGLRYLDEISVLGNRGVGLGE